MSQGWHWKFSEDGGYDCITDAYVVTNDKGETLFTLDMRDFGQQRGQYTTAQRKEAEGVVTLAAMAPRLREALRALSAAVAPTREGKRDGGTFGALSQADDEARAALREADGDA